MSIVKLVFAEMAYRKLGAVLGVLAVGVAAACVVAAVLLLRVFDHQTEVLVTAKEAALAEQMKRFEDDVRKTMIKLGFNILILPRDQNLSDFYADDFATRTMPESYAEKLAASKLVTINHVLPSLQQKVRWPEVQRTIMLIGVRGEVFMQSAKQKPLLEPVPAGTMMIGYELHQGLKLAVGDEVKLLGRTFKVAKLLEPRGTKDDITVWINLREAQELLDKPGQINAILALDCTCAPDRLSLIRPEVAAILPDTQVVEFASQALTRAEARTQAAEEARLAVRREREARDALRAQRTELAALVVPVILAGCAVWIGVLALLNVRQRQAEIGILRAVGVSTGKVLGLFLAKAACLGASGAVLGIAAGWAVGRWSEDPALLAAGKSLADPALFAAVLVAAPLLSAAVSAVPAWLATRQDPALVLTEL